MHGLFCFFTLCTTRYNVDFHEGFFFFCIPLAIVTDNVDIMSINKLFVKIENQEKVCSYINNLFPCFLRLFAKRLLHHQFHIVTRLLISPIAHTHKFASRRNVRMDIYCMAKLCKLTRIKKPRKGEKQTQSVCERWDRVGYNGAKTARMSELWSSEDENGDKIIRNEPRNKSKGKVMNHAKQT